MTEDPSSLPVGADHDDALALSSRAGLPDALRVLYERFPREEWEGHQNFQGLVSFWMQRHLMFRNLMGQLQTDLEAVVDRKISFDSYAPRLSRLGGMLLEQLHGHHQIEDHHYFPQLVRLDDRLVRGFDLLESDHEAMDGLLAEFADGANAVLRAGPGGEETTDFEGRLAGFGKLLERHLTDEEDLIVPVVLSTGFRG